MTLVKLRKIYGHDNVGTLSKGFRIIFKDGKAGIYSDELEEMITSFEFETSSEYTQVEDYGQKGWKFINFKKGNKFAYFHVYSNKIVQITPYIYDDQIYFGGRSRAKCCINGKYGLVEESSEELREIIPAKYDGVWYSGAGIVLKQNGKCGLFTNTVKPMIKKISDPFIFDDIYLPENRWDTFKFKIGNGVIPIYKEQFSDKYIFIKRIFV